MRRNILGVMIAVLFCTFTLDAAEACSPAVPGQSDDNLWLCPYTMISFEDRRDRVLGEAWAEVDAVFQQVKGDLKAALPKARTLAEAGNPAAKYIVGFIVLLDHACDVGVGMESHRLSTAPCQAAAEQGARLIVEAAEAGSHSALDWLRRLRTENGWRQLGMPADPDLMACWSAADRGELGDAACLSKTASRFAK